MSAIKNGGAPGGSKKNLLINLAVAVSAVLLITVFVLLSVLTAMEIKRTANLEKSVEEIKDGIGGADTGSNGLGGRLESIQNAINDLNNKLNQLDNKVTSNNTALLDKLTSDIAALNNAIAGLDTATQNKISNLQSDLNTKLTALSNTLSSLGTAIDNLNDLSVEDIEDIFDGKIQDVIDQYLSDVESYINSLVDGLSSSLQDIYDYLNGDLSDEIGAIQDDVTDILNFLNGYKDQLDKIDEIYDMLKELLAKSDIDSINVDAAGFNLSAGVAGSDYAFSGDIKVKFKGDAVEQVIPFGSDPDFAINFDTATGIVDLLYKNIKILTLNESHVDGLTVIRSQSEADAKLDSATSGVVIFDTTQSSGTVIYAIPELTNANNLVIYGNGVELEVAKPATADAYVEFSGNVSLYDIAFIGTDAGNAAAAKIATVRFKTGSFNLQDVLVHGYLGDAIVIESVTAFIADGAIVTMESDAVDGAAVYAYGNGTAEIKFTSGSIGQGKNGSIALGVLGSSVGNVVLLDDYTAFTVSGIIEDLSLTGNSLVKNADGTSNPQNIYKVTYKSGTNNAVRKIYYLKQALNFDGSNTSLIGWFLYGQDPLIDTPYTDFTSQLTGNLELYSFYNLNYSSAIAALENSLLSYYLNNIADSTDQINQSLSYIGYTSSSFFPLVFQATTPEELDAACEEYYDSFLGDLTVSFKAFVLGKARYQWLWELENIDTHPVTSALVANYFFDELMLFSTIYLDIEDYIANTAVSAADARGYAEAGLASFISVPDIMSKAEHFAAAEALLDTLFRDFYATVVGADTANSGDPEAYLNYTYAAWAGNTLATANTHADLIVAIETFVTAYDSYYVSDTLTDGQKNYIFNTAKAKWLSDLDGFDTQPQHPDIEAILDRYFLDELRATVFVGVYNAIDALTLGDTAGDARAYVDNMLQDLDNETAGILTKVQHYASAASDLDDIVRDYYITIADAFSADPETYIGYDFDAFFASEVASYEAENTLAGFNQVVNGIVADAALYEEAIFDLAKAKWEVDFIDYITSNYDNDASGLNAYLMDTLLGSSYYQAVLDFINGLSYGGADPAPADSSAITGFNTMTKAAKVRAYSFHQFDLLLNDPSVPTKAYMIQEWIESALIAYYSTIAATTNAYNQSLDYLAFSAGQQSYSFALFFPDVINNSISGVKEAKTESELQAVSYLTTSIVFNGSATVLSDYAKAQVFVWAKIHWLYDLNSFDQIAPEDLDPSIAAIGDYFASDVRASVYYSDAFNFINSMTFNGSDTVPGTTGLESKGDLARAFVEYQLSLLLNDPSILSKTSLLAQAKIDIEAAFLAYYAQIDDDNTTYNQDPAVYINYSYEAFFASVIAALNSAQSRSDFDTVIDGVLTAGELADSYKQTVYNTTRDRWLYDFENFDDNEDNEPWATYKDQYYADEIKATVEFIAVRDYIAALAWDDTNNTGTEVRIYALAAIGNIIAGLQNRQTTIAAYINNIENAVQDFYSTIAATSQVNAVDVGYDFDTFFSGLRADMNAAPSLSELENLYYGVIDQLAGELLDVFKEAVYNLAVANWYDALINFNTQDPVITSVIGAYFFDELKTTSYYLDSKDYLEALDYNTNLIDGDTARAFVNGKIVGLTQGTTVLTKAQRLQAFKDAKDQEISDWYLNVAELGNSASPDSLLPAFYNYSFDTFFAALSAGLDTIVAAYGADLADFNNACSNYYSDGSAMDTAQSAIQTTVRAKWVGYLEDFVRAHPGSFATMPSFDKIMRIVKDKIKDHNTDRIEAVCLPLAILYSSPAYTTMIEDYINGNSNLGITVSEVSQYAVANQPPHWIGVNLQNPSGWILD